MARKIYCEVIEGIAYEDRCLFHLSQIIEGNRTCEECILREVERIKFGKTKKPDVSDIKDIKKRRRKIKSSPGKKPKPVENEGTAETYSSKELIELLGKPDRTIRKWAQKGKIPAYKIGKEWNFPKDEIDRWLSEKGTTSLHCHDVVTTINMASQEGDPCPPDMNVEGSLKTQEHE